MIRKLIAGLAALFLAAQPAFAALLVDNVNGYTIGADGRLVRFGAMLVGDDGKVERLYQRGERRPERARYRFDGKGRTLLPGLIDAHGHVMALGLNALQLDLSDTKTLAGGAGEDRRLCRRQPDSALDRRPRLEPGDLGPRPLPDRRRARLRRRATGRSGSGGSTAMPAGPTAWR